jgi:ABC-2 type transport system ATP-binding protein
MAQGMMTTTFPAVSVRGLRKRYGDVVAVDGLDLDVRSGECFGLLGPNGAGKTTTIEICEGLTTQDEGDVEILGMRWTSDPSTLRQRLGIQLQDTQLSEKLTVSETIQLFRSFFERGADVDALLGMVQLREKAGARVGALSGGQKQRLALACALAGDPAVLFLDEPTTGLDPQSRRQLWELVESLKRMGRTIVLTTHYMDEAERLCDRIAIIDKGRVIALDTPRALIQKLGAQHVIEFSVPPAALSEIQPSLFASIPGVLGTRIHADRVSIEVEHLHRALPDVLATIAGREITPTEFRTHTATLEDLFVHLTGRQLRDG